MKYTSEFDRTAQRMRTEQLIADFKRDDATLAAHNPPDVSKYEFEKAETVDVMLRRQAYAVEIARRVARK